MTMTPTMTESAIRAACWDAAGRRDRAALRLATAALADLLEEQGDVPRAAAPRAGRWQRTAPGTRVVTVGRDGAKTANTGGRHSVAVWTTKIYVATPRAHDGTLVWRLINSLGAHSTSGRAVSGRMIARAEAYAAERGLEYRPGTVAWSLCP